jgi:saccharopepsin
MKAAALLAVTAAMAGSASAGVHKMKLSKVPLEEQLKSHSMHDMGKLLSQKYGRKLSRMDMHLKEMFAPQTGHKLPVNNYMNAQCTSA